MIYITRGGNIFHLVRNAGHCSHCDNIIESVQPHDAVYCECGFSYVSGGIGTRWVNRGHPDYWTSFVQWQDLSSRVMYYTSELPST
jgi:hypothetical protein